MSYCLRKVMGVKLNILQTKSTKAKLRQQEKNILTENTLTVSLAKLQEVREEDTSAQAGSHAGRICGGRKTGVFREKPFLLAAIELGPHWWEVNAPTTTPSLLPAYITHAVPFFFCEISTHDSISWHERLFRFLITMVILYLIII